MRERDRLDRIIESARAPVPVDAAAVQRIVERVRNSRPTGRRRRAALAFTLLLALALVPFVGRNHGSVEFRIDAPGARRVALVGDFNDWNPDATPLSADGSTWRVSVRLPAGAHEYGFVIDATRWIADPVAPAAPAEDFGMPTSLVFVQ